MDNSSRRFIVAPSHNRANRRPVPAPRCSVPLGCSRFAVCPGSGPGFKAVERWLEARWRSLSPTGVKQQCPAADNRYVENTKRQNEQDKSVRVALGAAPRAELAEVLS